ncbi:MAG: DUF3866 family protein [Abditibacteriota bacterium]|nr:DUF3866 family protein [Abditibacteriota bacterium]
MLTREIATVSRIVVCDGASAEAEIIMTDGSRARAFAYAAIAGELREGDRVLVNTTACRKALGTGGVHFVIADLTRPEETAGDDRGHIVKCRYTPVQHTVMSVEEQGSPYHYQLERADSLEGLPVVCGQLHSQLPLLCCALKELDPGCRIAYVMTDYSSLPIGFSRLVKTLKQGGALDWTITCGQAFGGDYEAVNACSAMVFARDVLKADYAAVLPGPGNAGTGTRLGFGSLDMAGVLNGAAVMKGRCVCIPRICFADQRPRHRGLSHHTATMLRDFVLLPVIVPLPAIDDPDKSRSLDRQLEESGIGRRHRLIRSSCRAGKDLADRLGIRLSTMGHSFEDTPEFFLASSAAAEIAVKLKKGEAPE